MGLPAEELHALVPLVHVVRVLPQHDAAEQDGPPLHQVLQPRQPGPHSTSAAMRDGRDPDDSPRIAEG